MAVEQIFDNLIVHIDGTFVDFIIAVLENDCFFGF